MPVMVKFFAHETHHPQKKLPHSIKGEAVRVSCQIVGWVTFVTQHRSAGRLSTHVTQHRLMMVLGCQTTGNPTYAY